MPLCFKWARRKSLGGHMPPERLFVCYTSSYGNLFAALYLACMMTTQMCTVRTAHPTITIRLFDFWVQKANSNAVIHTPTGSPGSLTCDTSQLRVVDPPPEIRAKMSELVVADLKGQSVLKTPGSVAGCVRNSKLVAVSFRASRVIA